MLLRRAFIGCYQITVKRSLLQKRGGLPALAASPGLTQGIGKAEDLQKKLYEAEIREDTAEDFDKPRSEMDSAQELMGEYRRQRAEEQEVAKRIHATTEWRRYDEELQLEVNTLYAEFNEKVLAGMPMTKLNVKELNDARVEACEFYYSKHREVLEPIVARIENEVEREIKSGKLVVGEPDDEFLQKLHDIRAEQYPQYFVELREDERIEESIKDISAPTYRHRIAATWDQDAVDHQKEHTFVRTSKRNS